MRLATRGSVLPLVLAALLAFGAAGAAAAAPQTSAWWALTSQQTPTIFEPGGEGKILLSATDIGDAGVNATDSPLTISDTLPPGLEETSVAWNVGFGSPTYHEQWPTGLLPPCAVAGQTVTCTMEPFEPFLPVAALEPKLRIEVEIAVKVSPSAGAGEANEATVSGGEALACHEVEPEAGGFTDALCSGGYPFRSSAIPTEIEGRDFEQEASGRPVPAAHVSRPLAVGEEEVPFGVEQYEFGAEEEGGAAATQAGSHPAQLTTNFVFNQRLERTRGETEGRDNAEALPAPPRDLSFELPPGFIGNPTAVARCTAAQFFSKPSIGTLADNCPADSAVGVAMVTLDEPQNVKLVTMPVPVFNLEPTFGEPARFGMFVGGVLPVVLDASVRTGSDYGITVTARRVPEIAALLSSRVTFWGSPGDPRHDAQRGWSCVAGGFYVRIGEGIPACGASQSPSGTEAKPFLRLPTSCSPAQPTPMRMRSWLPGAEFTPPLEPASEPRTEACNRPPFEPRIEVQPEVHAAETPTGLTVRLNVPQEASEAPGGIAEADLRDAVVALPQGVAVNPASAAGLGACAPQQIDLHGPGPARCPASAKIGTVTVRTPLLERPLSGAVYVATQGDNPFHSLLAIYVAVEDPQSGVVVKLAGHVVADPRTGQLTTSFSQNPQLPFESFELHFFGGPQAALATPPLCGTYATATQMAPWSVPEGGVAHPGDSFAIGSGANGGACAGSPQQLPDQPSFEAGTVNPLSASYSPFVLSLRRADGTQRLSSIETTLPLGLLGKLKGIPYCPEQALRAAEAKSGREEQASPSCPAASEVGEVTVGAGAGPQPYYVGGHAYLTGPYKGAPLGLAVVTPAVAGPYDLGTVVVRAALHVNEETAQIRAVSDPFPTILQGIPLDVRSIALRMSRPEFTLNPSSCEATAVTGEAVSTLGQSAPLSDRFQVGGCRRLGFAPRLALRLFGPTRRARFPRLRAVLRSRPGEANIAAADVTLPHSEFLEQGHIGTVCTRVQYHAGAVPGEGCPAASVYGHATASTPLLDHPLSGPVFLRSSDHELPDLVAALRGQIDVSLVGIIDSVHGGIRTRFESVPDAPVSRFVLAMKGGRKSLLVNSRNLCAAPGRATVRMTAHNGKLHELRPPIRDSCGGKRRKGHASHARR